MDFDEILRKSLARLGRECLDFGAVKKFFADSRWSRILYHYETGRCLSLRCVCQVAALFSVEVWDL